MGIFSNFFGSSSSRYPTREFPLPEVKLRQLVSGTLIGTLESSEEKAVEEAILARRFGDGKISLRQIDEVLRRLQDQNRISPNDRRSLMRVFEKYCQA